ncbi:MAG TPA: membrane protein insertase YidC [Buchnera sp. (in: enterobacteria)]|nr:membrane protein insertase YidC [Buchnera sp. (in: enterobacteria)]
MALQRNILIFSFLFICFLLWQIWQTKITSDLAIKKIEQNQVNLFNHTAVNKKNIFIKTNVISLSINRNGGDIEQANLLKYKNKLHSLQPLSLLTTTPDFFYQAQSGLTGKDGPDNPHYNLRPFYKTAKSYFKLKHGQQLRVPMLWIDTNHIVYIKTFVFKSDTYDVKVEYTIKNNTNKTLEYSIFGQLKQSVNLPKIKNTHSNNFALQTFRGAAYSTDDNKYNKYNFGNISEDKNLYVKTNHGWIAMLQQYFATAWIPQSQRENIIYTSNFGHNIVGIGYKSDTFYVIPNTTNKVYAKLWIGPEIQDKMSNIASNLDLTVDYGFLWFLSQPLFKLLKVLYHLIGNWGVAIVLITVIMRIIIYPLSKSQYISIAKMRLLQPKINDLKIKFADNRTRLSQEIMMLYKKEKINPLGGCLPVFIQMPIFLALYYMLMSSVELRHAPFYFWIHDLSSQDPYYILPVIMGITMFYIQKISPNTVTDPFQKKIMGYSPILFTIFFLWFPSGLVLYYIISNIITILQQKFFYYYHRKIIINKYR